MLVEISKAKRILEIGAFTGYSATCMAYGLPEDGHIDTLEINHPRVESVLLPLRDGLNAIRKL